MADSDAVSNVIIDISHHNGDALDFVQAKGAGIVGVFQKASQGRSYTDPTYLLNRHKAKAAGLLWGAYHFGTGVDVSAQVNNFLTVVGDPKGTVLVLDLEENKTKDGKLAPSMTLQQARDFVSQIRSRTGRYPGLYSGNTLKDKIKTELKGKSDPVLSQCWLWLAQYGPTASLPAGWNSWTIWQYTDGKVGPTPREVAGIGPCDRDKFSGVDVAQWWGENS